MNAVDLLNENEKKIFVQMLKGQTLSQVADTCRCTTDEINNVRLLIIDKFEQSSPVKSPVPRRFQFIAGD